MYKQTDDFVLENFSSFLYNKFIEVKKIKSNERKIESLTDFFGAIEVVPENAFSLKTSVNLKSKIYELLNKKGYQTNQYSDIRTYLVALDSFDYLTYGSLQDTFLDLNSVLQISKLKSLTTCERVEKALKLQPTVVYIKSLNERLLKHVSTMMKLVRQGVVVNKTLVTFVTNKIKIQISLLRFLLPLEACLYKLTKGFGIIHKMLLNTFAANSPQVYNVLSRYFLFFFERLAHLRVVFSDSSELFNVKQTLAGSIQNEIKKSINLMEQLLPVSQIDLQNTVQFSFELFTFFQKNEVL